MANDDFTKQLIVAITERNVLECKKDSSVLKLKIYEIEAFATVTGEALKKNPTATADDIIKALIKDSRTGLKEGLTNLTKAETGSYILQQIAKKQAGFKWSVASEKKVKEAITDQLLPTIDGMLKDNRHLIEKASNSTPTNSKLGLLPSPTLQVAFQPIGGRGFGV